MQLHQSLKLYLCVFHGRKCEGCTAFIKIIVQHQADVSVSSQMSVLFGGKKAKISIYLREKMCPGKYSGITDTTWNGTFVQTVTKLKRK